MEMMPGEGRTDRLAVVFGACVPKEFSTESVVPDTMPDIDRILDAETAIYIRSKTLDDGEITLDGVISAVILYSSAEDDAVQKIDISVPVSIECRDGDIKSGDVLLSETAVASAEARMLNPRKLVFRSDTVTEIKLLRSEPLDFSCAGADTPGIEKLMTTASVGIISSAVEKAFTVSEEIALPDRAALDDLLSFHTQVTSESLKKVGSRAILQGAVLLSVLYTKEADGTLSQESFLVPFSQILEAPPEEASMEARLFQTACYLEPIPGLTGAASLSLEVHLTAQLLCTSCAEETFVADAYSIRGRCETVSRNAASFGPFEAKELRQTIRERADAPGGVKNVISVFPTASLPAMGAGSVRLPMTVHVLYLDADDRLQHAVKRISPEIPTGEEGEAQYFLSQYVFREVNASAQQDGIELRLETELKYVKASTLQIRSICAVQTDEAPENEPGERPSIIVIRPGEATMWELAKKYRSTCALIEEANPAGADPDKLLLIPRAR